jgi:hypothetical protein
MTSAIARCVLEHLPSLILHRFNQHVRLIPVESFDALELRKRPEV